MVKQWDTGLWMIGYKMRGLLRGAVSGIVVRFGGCGPGLAGESVVDVSHNDRGK